MNFRQATYQGIEDVEVTCLVTAVPIEGESLEVELCSTVENLRENIHFILRHSCTRLREVHMTLLEDMDVFEKLSTKQCDSLMQIISTQFPYGPSGELLDPDAVYKASSTRILLRKMTNHKEQIALRAAGAFTGVQVSKIIAYLTQLTSQRMLETNTNDLTAYDLLKKQSPEDQMMLQMVLDTLYGRMQPEMAASRLNAYKEDKQLNMFQRNGEANVD